MCILLHIQDLPPNKKFIRGISYITGFLIQTSTNGCSLHYVTQSDPKGLLDGGKGGGSGGGGLGRGGGAR